MAPVRVGPTGSLESMYLWGDEKLFSSLESTVPIAPFLKAVGAEHQEAGCFRKP